MKINGANNTPIVWSASRIYQASVFVLDWQDEFLDEEIDHSSYVERAIGSATIESDRPAKMDPDDRRVDAWEETPGPCVLAVMAVVVLVALPFALLIGLKDLLLPARPAEAEGFRDDVTTVAPGGVLSPPRLVPEDGQVVLV